MKASVIIAILLTVGQVFAAQDPVVYCRGIITENGVVEEHQFTFECDNYGEGTTFTSKSGRFYMSAFSEESCSPQLIIHDLTTKSFTNAFTGASGQEGFAVFKDRLVVGSLAADVERDQVTGGVNPKSKVVLGCSTKKSLLNDLD